MPLSLLRILMSSLLHQEHRVIKQHQPSTAKYNQVSLRIYLRCIRSTALLGTSTSHHRKRKIILKRFQKCLGRGYVSSLEGICKRHLHTIFWKRRGSWERRHQDNIHHDPSTIHWLQCPSFKGSDSSRSTHMRSKRLRIGSERFTFCEKVLHFAGCHCFLTVFGGDFSRITGMQCEFLYIITREYMT